MEKVTQELLEKHFGITDINNIKELLSDLKVTNITLSKKDLCLKYFKSKGKYPFIKKLKDLNIIGEVKGPSILVNGKWKKGPPTFTLPDQCMSEQEFFNLPIQEEPYVEGSKVILTTLHSKFKNEVPQYIEITEKNMEDYKRIRDFVIENYFEFDRSEVERRCVEGGMNYLVADYLAAKSLQNIKQKSL